MKFTSLERFKSKIREIPLLKKHKGYINKYVMWLINCYLIMFLGADYVLNDYSFLDANLSCNNGLNNTCINPIYQCTEHEVVCVSQYLMLKDLLPISLSDVSGISGSLQFDCLDVNPTQRCAQVPKYLCDKFPCDRKTLNDGESFGRSDFLHNYKFTTFFAGLLILFGLNHYLYWRKQNATKK